MTTISPSVNGSSASSPIETAAALPSQPATASWHWPTVIFAALPATLLAFPAAVAILFGAVFSLGLKAMAFVMLACGVLSWLGMLSLWSAARSPGRVVSKRTARGLVAGIAAVLMYYGIEIFTDEQDSRLWSFTPLLTIGPLWYAISYLRRYRKHRHLYRDQIGEQADGYPQAVAIQSTGTAATQAEPSVEARPFNEGKMRKILTFLWIVPAYIELVTVPQMLETRAGLGHLAVFIFSFPFYLGIAVTAGWCFRRSPALRRLATATLVTPILLPFVLHWMMKGLGHELTTQITFIAGIAIPALILLLVPKRVAGYLPRFAIDSRWFNVAWLGLLAVMLIPWAVLAICFSSLKESGSPVAFTFLVWYAGASIVIALISLFMAYIGLRTQQRKQTGLRIAQIGLGLVHLLIGCAVAATILFLLGLAGMG